ncbi:P-loop containing nucleoside triphosphate hydrolase protein [Parasitella parasitica]|nr:P-loop containing nucleoside triphosphate hydrolase protein [Parasitella parasitica]
MVAHVEDASPVRNLTLACLAFFTGGRIHTLPSGQVRIIFKWHYFVISVIAACIATTIIIQTTTIAWNTAGPDDDESIFLPFTSKKVPAKWRNYITNQPLSHPTHHPKLYYPRNCPHFTPEHSKSCAKPVPSFIFAGSEFAGASYVFRMLKHHPQVASASVDNSGPSANHVFDTQEFDEANAFDSYISQFPFLKDDVLATMEEGRNWIVGENAPHYLYSSHLTAKRIKDTLPHVKLVFLLREPIARAYSQYVHEKSGNSNLSFETLIDLELPILRRCGHTSTQTGWDGFVSCHQGSEIRTSWRVPNDTHSYNSLAKGMYYPALVPFLQQFTPSQLFVIRTEDILLNPSGSFQRLARFLDIDPTYFAERNFYQDEQHLTEEELLSSSADLDLYYPHLHDSTLFDNSTTTADTEKGAEMTSPAINHHLPKAQSMDKSAFLQQKPRHRVLINNQQIHPVPYIPSVEEPELSIRYRLQTVYRNLNSRLIYLFDQKMTSFYAWVYDVDRG